ncbi:P-loop containing nucleoside triphosphate hydrolase protein [Mycena epipterygia]|nr:P-loop containing nucleoside triphosphate hydrolase protein [Mycena epipterygia]
MHMVIINNGPTGPNSLFLNDLSRVILPLPLPFDAPPTWSEDDHVQRTLESQRILQAAREKARRRDNYDSARTRRELTRLFEEKFQKPPYEWQIDVSEAIVLGLDAVVIAGTGAGKTIPFMMPLLLHPQKFVLVISPLKILQEDQAKRFKKMGLKAAAVNGDTYSRELQKDLHTQTHNAILTSPEMCFEHQDFRKWLRDEQTGKRIMAVIVDEAHCASQWGGDFRPHYAMLHRLRAILPVGNPILAASATLSPSALTEVCSGLNLDFDRSFFLNLGNDRPNITPSIVRMNGSKDYAAIDPHLPNPADVHSADDLPKTITFTNAVKKTQVIFRHLRRLYPNVRGAIDFLHAHRSVKAKRRVMKQFRKGKIKILIATEAAGMGADIPDIELIIQFGVPSSLSVWTQRAGRAGRSPELHARAILLVEKSMFQRRKKRKRGAGKEKPVAPEPESSDSDSGSDSGAEDSPESNAPRGRGKAMTADPDDGLEWGKNVDPILREYISTAECRRDMSDLHFKNPPRHPPMGECCDNCTALEQQVQPPSPPKTPEPPDSSPSSAQSTPSKNRNANGKRTMVRGDGPKTRRKDHLKRARSTLETWRTKIYLSTYSNTSLTPEVLLPDIFLSSLASHRSTSEQDPLALVSAWAFVKDHGADVLNALARLDRAVHDEREREKEANKARKTSRTAAKASATVGSHFHQHNATCSRRTFSFPSPDLRDTPHSCHFPYAAVADSVTSWLSLPTAFYPTHAASTSLLYTPDTHYLSNTIAHSFALWLSIPSAFYPAFYPADTASTSLFPG